MADQQKPSNPADPHKGTPSNIGSSSSNIKGGYSNSRQKPHFSNPPDAANPDTATPREQWRFAIRQYSKMYSHAWGTAIFAGMSFFALGWIIKGSNPLPSRQEPDNHPQQVPSTASEDTT